MFSGIGNIHAVNDAFEELRNALDPLRTRLTERRKEDSFMADIVVSTPQPTVSAQSDIIWGCAPVGAEYILAWKRLGDRILLRK